jgi:hypothetical protein
VSILMIVEKVHGVMGFLWGSWMEPGVISDKSQGLDR